MTVGFLFVWGGQFHATGIVAFVFLRFAFRFLFGCSGSGCVSHAALSLGGGGEEGGGGGRGEEGRGVYVTPKRAVRYMSLWTAKFYRA